jgi:hypothetical protein
MKTTCIGPSFVMVTIEISLKVLSQEVLQIGIPTICTFIWDFDEAGL